MSLRRVSFRLCFENCYQKKKLYIGIYEKKNVIDYMPYIDLNFFARVLFRNRLKNKLNVYNVRISWIKKIQKK